MSNLTSGIEQMQKLLRTVNGAMTGMELTLDWSFTDEDRDEAYRSLMSSTVELGMLAISSVALGLVVKREDGKPEAGESWAFMSSVQSAIVDKFLSNFTSDQKESIMEQKVMSMMSELAKRMGAPSSSDAGTGSA